MYHDNVRIVFANLPARVRPLGEAELSSVFGGCDADGKPCQNACTCCGWACTNGACASSV